METGKEIYEPYEVFVRSTAIDGHQHVGSVLAPSPEVALVVARENFLRRENAASLWVVPSKYVYQSPSEGAFFGSELDKSYRRVDGYSDNAKRWKAFKQQALHLEDIVKDVEGGNAE